MSKKNLIAFVGLSHLSFSYSLAAAKKNYKIMMYDFEDKLMKKFKDFKLDFNEKSLLEKFKKYKNFNNLENNLKSLNKFILIFIS